MNQDKIKMREKLSFAMANFGNIPVMTLINGYLLIFYTNICGLSPAACATLFLIARFLDAINDPLVGFMIDHLPTRKMGHFREQFCVAPISFYFGLDLCYQHRGNWQSHMYRIFCLVCCSQSWIFR